MTTCGRCAQETGTDSTFCRFCGARVGHTPGATRRLCRVPAEGRLGGVCAGIARYADIDVTFVRLAAVLLAIIPGMIVGGVLVYAGAWVLMPATWQPEPVVPTGRRLYRSVSNRTLAGVCGGLAEYFNVDSTVVRIAAVILTVYPGAIIGGVLAYAIGWLHSRGWIHRQ
jgi:phage shock protein PspC (stress-responsive transcriptional regulator)